MGLLNMTGDLVIPFKYSELGVPSHGRVAFRKTSEQPCGYMDYTEKVLIKPQFNSCGTFGKKGALVEVEEKGELKTGFIGFDGTWLIPPTYDEVDDWEALPAALELYGLKSVPGYQRIGKKQGKDHRYGLFDLDQGREIFPPIYAQIGFLTPERFLFSDDKSPMLPFVMDADVGDKVRAVGLMDAQGKVLLAPSRFTYIELHKSGRYLMARDSAETRVQALYDLDGRELIGPKWSELKIDAAHSVVLAYSMNEPADFNLSAAYSLQGELLFSVQKTACGAEQIVNGANKPVWPLDLTPYCTDKPKQ